MKKWMKKIAIGTLALSMATTVIPSHNTAEAASNVTFKGKGFGHGIGMSQYGAKGMAEKKYKYDQILKFYYTGVSLTKKDTSKQNVRVALGFSRSTADISATGRYVVRDARTKKVLLTANGNSTTRVTNSGGYTKFYHLASKRTYKTKNPVWIEPASTGSFVRYKGNRYDGKIYLTASKNRVNLINYVKMEDYVAGVTPYEMYPSWPAEALKAQSVAARTYAISHLNPKRSWDVDDTIMYQVYKGKSPHEGLMKALVKQTNGMIITYKGAPIDALFYSSSGGQTVNSEDVWGSKIPYLRGKKDPYDNSPFNKKPWSYSVSKSSLGAMYGVGTVKTVKVTGTSQGRPTYVTIYGTKGSKKVKASDLRMKLGGTNVKSTYFTIYN